MAKSNCICLSFDLLVTRTTDEMFPPSRPWNMCTEIRACAPCNSIFKNCNWWNQYQYSCFEINGGFYHSRQIHGIYKRWMIQSEDVLGCIGGKIYKHHHLLHATNYFSERFFTHALQGVWKATVLDLKSEDDEGKIDVCVETFRKSLATCVTSKKRVHLSQ